MAGSGPSGSMGLEAPRSSRSMGVAAVVESSWAPGLAEGAPWARFRLGAGVVPVGGSTAASEPGGGCVAAQAGAWVELVGAWAAAGGE